MVPNMQHKRSRVRGIAVVEFTLSLMFFIPLLLGTYVFGFRLIRSLEMEQIVRDLGHMYIRGINFRNAGPIANAQTLASGFNLTSTGDSVVIFSAIKVIQQTDCDAANPLQPAGSVHCTNLGNPVFTEEVFVGNTSLTINGANAAQSGFGSPPRQADSTVSVANQGNNSTAAAGNTAALSGFAKVLALNAGEVAYMVEMINGTPALSISGLSGTPQVYARSVF
jgi:hypothetical protein